MNARYHPQVNPTERVNRVLVTAISSYIKDSHREWDKHIFDIAQAILFGRHVPPTGDFYAPVNTNGPLEIAKKLFWSRELAQLPELYDDVKWRVVVNHTRGSLKIIAKSLKNHSYSNAIYI
ncbi:hypothetical protein RN001_013643 [Aquatica leii]|uniref:Uncharacterized protein n=1 Tax=Aquatica leii TaxID=1421715 RepID=A0AAN7P333_9COLE|nr:hypothetical protein RN001_013643 [Aquatica leii]